DGCAGAPERAIFVHAVAEGRAPYVATSVEGESMTTRVARCACGRVEVTVEGEPLQVYVCHCDFCQRRSGNVFIASAQFPEGQVISISGEMGTYNGLEV